MNIEIPPSPPQPPPVVPPPPSDGEKKAVDLAFDITKQFLTIALAGIAFVVGLSSGSPGAISSVMFWFTVGAFGISAVMGLLFLMNGVNTLSVKQSYDVYATSLRILAVIQIGLVLVGVVLLLPDIANHPAGSSGAIEIKFSDKSTTTYPVQLGKSLTIEVQSGTLICGGR